MKAMNVKQPSTHSLCVVNNFLVDDMKCKLICIRQNSRELYVTDENLIDGTPCSYENTTNICIQGVCHTFGCDGKLFSSLKVDSCGTCGGNNTECTKIQIGKQKKLKRGLCLGGCGWGCGFNCGGCRGEQSGLDTENVAGD